MVGDWCCSGRHKQEESLFEEMLQVSNAVVSYLCVYVCSKVCMHAYVRVPCLYNEFWKMPCSFPFRILITLFM